MARQRAVAPSLQEWCSVLVDSTIFATFPPLPAPGPPAHVAFASGQGLCVIRLLIADDHPGVRSGLVDLFRSTADITVVAECTDGDEVLAAARSSRPHVALLDLVMPRMTGLDAAAHLRAECPAVKVVLLTGTVGSSSMTEARALGVAGFLAKGQDSDALPAHIRTVAGGGSAWPEAAVAGGLPR